MDKFRKLIRITVSLVSIVLFLSFAGFYYISLKSEEDSAREEIEDLSERQQIRSQAILKNVLLIIGENNVDDSMAISGLRKDLPRFRQKQQFLEQNVSAASLGNLKDAQELERVVREIKPLHTHILLTGYRTLRASDRLMLHYDSKYLKTLNQQEASYLNEMSVISEIARKNQEIMEERLYWINMIILAALIITLILLALMVITPIFKSSIRDYQRLLIAKNEAEAASKARSEFMSNMSHELRTPMNSIIGFTDIALATDLNDTQREYLQLVGKSSYILLDIINDILDFSKIEAGKLIIEYLPFNLRKVIEETVDMLSIRTHEKDIELICNIDPDIPSQFLGDASRIKQVLINLLGNAVKFTERGEILVNVKKENYIFNKDNERYLNITIEVHDTGIGVPEGQLKKIFESFTQADSSTTREYGGTGLGLTIAKNLVQLMGGTLEVQSEYGKGSIFVFHLSLGVIKEKPFVNFISNPLSHNVMVVDDNATNCNLVKGIFDFFDIPCTVCNSGIEALTIIEESIQTQTMFDLIITDHQMPGMDGFKLVKKIRNLAVVPTESFVLMLSSLENDFYKREAEAIGINAFLSKPVKFNDIVSILSVVFEKNVPHKKSTAVNPNIEKFFEGTRIVVAEDNPMNMILISKVLSKMGFDILKATTGKEVLEIATTQSPDLIFMDLHMPEMDGYAAAKAIRSLPPPNGKVIIIALTADAMKGDKEKCLAAGMNDFIAKPFRVPEIEMTLKKYLPRVQKTALS